MFAKPVLLISIVQVALLLGDVGARILLLERDGRHIYPRRFGQENPAVLSELRAACTGGVCDTLAGEAITPLLAAQPECSQQDMADKIIDTASQFDAATQKKMIAAAVKYRQAEKNTSPDFTMNPPGLRNSVFCQKAPKNPQLKGLVQAQDPSNDPNLFFDPAKGATVKLGSQSNTSPFGANSKTAAPDNKTPAPNDKTPAPNDKTPAPNNTTSTPSNPGDKTATTDNGGQFGNFGSCTVPQIDFGQGFDGRKETSFRPTDSASYSHGSAQNIDIITQFMCDQLVNSCKADATAKATCANAKTAASSATPVKSGAQADAFNAVFGITTTFAKDPVFDDQGRLVSGTVAKETANGGIGDFGSCSVPEVEFGAGFDGRRETAFQPTDLKSYSHGSAQNFDVIGQFVCDQLVNTCKADATARATCAQARTAAGAAPPKTGKQADAFNAVFGKQTNFANVTPLDNQGQPITARSVPSRRRRHPMNLSRRMSALP